MVHIDYSRKPKRIDAQKVKDAMWEMIMTSYTDSSVS